MKLSANFLHFKQNFFVINEMALTIFYGIIASGIVC